MIVSTYGRIPTRYEGGKNWNAHSQWEILLDNVSSRCTTNILLQLYVRVNTPGVGHYWNKDPPEVEPWVFLFQLCPCSVGVVKHIQNLKKQGRTCCKMKWHAHQTVIGWRVFHFKKCSSHYDLPSKTALNLMSTCSNMFPFLHRVDISSWCPLEL